MPSRSPVVDSADHAAPADDLRGSSRRMPFRRRTRAGTVCACGRRIRGERHPGRTPSHATLPIGKRSGSPVRAGAAAPSGRGTGTRGRAGRGRRAGPGRGRRGLRGGARAAGVGGHRTRCRSSASRTSPTDGCDSATLPAHGYFTVADVLRAGPDRLIARARHRRGHGGRRWSARPSRSSRRCATRSSSASSSIRTTPVTTRLLQALAVVGRGAARQRDARAERDRARRGSGRRCARSPHRPPPGRLRRLFLRGSSKARAGAALERIGSLLQLGRLDRPAAGGAGRPDGHGAQRRPRSGATSSGARPSTTGCSARSSISVGDVAAAEGYLPADIVERVNAQRLDTSRLKESLRLRGYQSFGARFALVQRRVILGDEMGLGKTIQAIATMAHLAATGSHPLPGGVPGQRAHQLDPRGRPALDAAGGRAARRRPGPGDGALASTRRGRGDHVRLAGHADQDTAEAGAARRRRGPLREEPGRQAIAGRTAGSRPARSGCCS